MFSAALIRTSLLYVSLLSSGLSFLTKPRCQIAAVSVGVVGGRVRLDLPYEEDARAEVDMNVVATDVGTLVEVQGTAEGATFARRTLDAMLDSALAGIAELAVLQRLEAQKNPRVRVHPIERAYDHVVYTVDRHGCSASPA